MAGELDFGFLSDYWPAIAWGVVWTFVMTVASLIPGAAFGVLCALARVYGSPTIARIAAVYVEVIRNTPSLIQAFWLFFGLASLGLRLSPFMAAVLALSINFAAYVGEIIRAGLEATPHGEIEAADCLGLSPLQRITAIELPQAIERVFPALVGQSILMMLSTSIMYQISAEELTGVAWYIQSFTFRSFEIYMIVAALYIGMTGLMRAALSSVGLLVFTRYRRLRTPL
ncbi:amino acid ABC transporter permease [Azospirillum sp. TSH64]|uniref:amino acid ABC transporter permease n=1 Tax=Azospirillum sp. TSH64 TaxID=652740 RepID=UPI000D60F7CD|nr:amino acid ABC transporter permease [Azospirillum sp. TSH64]PWC78100.1 ABC transporter permease [Azospirillum sp. TSH64]